MEQLISLETPLFEGHENVFTFDDNFIHPCLRFYFIVSSQNISTYECREWLKNSYFGYLIFLLVVGHKGNVD